MGNVFIFDHPLITHKISLLRDVRTSTKDFRAMIEEITTLMLYEALRDLDMMKVDITTPICNATVDILSDNEPIIIPILRAGLGMVNGVTSVMPLARIGHLGVYRDHETLEPKEYYINFPEDIDKRLVIVLDPMLATGGSSAYAIDCIKKAGAKKIKLICILGVQEGIDMIQKKHPDIDLYLGKKDDCLNDIGYIVPGLGDAGDRIFGTCK